MAQRQPFIEPSPADCTLGVVGENQVYDTCAYKLKDAKRIIFKLKSGINPFTTSLLLETELTWDTLLALDTTSTPDNVMLTTKIYESSQTAGDANIVTSSSGSKEVTHYNEDSILLSFAYLEKQQQRDLIAAIRDNSNSLECMIINTDGRIRHGIDLLGNPTWIPIKVATMKTRTIAGRETPELNELMMEFEPEVLDNALELTTPDGWSIFDK